MRTQARKGTSFGQERGSSTQADARVKITMLSNQAVIDAGKKVLIGNYGRRPVAMVRGNGSHLWDADGRQYIDLFAGFGGAVLGHCHPTLVQAATEQAAKLWHV